ncbi:hypothetical protein SLEP1_g22528 [Rubroshorea leprosula]|uniref:Uncharacterized protein n=1 Tax=Rubroshorea leprosula TaxID=152421 RepID=A0AAV5JCH5_9ROSI|nr:hypothetical protein SLEP1_g22528 [Rubroshorea leprosula]
MEGQRYVHSLDVQSPIPFHFLSIIHLPSTTSHGRPIRRPKKISGPMARTGCLKG